MYRQHDQCRTSPSQGLLFTEQSLALADGTLVGCMEDNVVH